MTAEKTTTNRRYTLTTSAGDTEFHFDYEGTPIDDGAYAHAAAEYEIAVAQGDQAARLTRTVTLTSFTGDDAARLALIEAEFAAAGGRGVDLAEEIDALHAKQDGQDEVELRLSNASPLCSVTIPESALHLITAALRNYDIDICQTDGFDPWVDHENPAENQMASFAGQVALIRVAEDAVLDGLGTPAAPPAPSADDLAAALAAVNAAQNLAGLGDTAALTVALNTAAELLGGGTAHPSGSRVLLTALVDLDTADPKRVQHFMTEAGGSIEATLNENYSDKGFDLMGYEEVGAVIVGLVTVRSIER